MISVLRCTTGITPYCYLFSHLPIGRVPPISWLSIGVKSMRYNNHHYSSTKTVSLLVAATCVQLETIYRYHCRGSSVAPLLFLVSFGALLGRDEGIATMLKPKGEAIQTARQASMDMSMPSIRSGQLAEATLGGNQWLRLKRKPRILPETPAETTADQQPRTWLLGRSGCCCQQR